MTQLMNPISSWELDPFDLLWKNVFDNNYKFNTLVDKINYPVDIYEEPNGITFELAVVGLDKEDIQIQVQGENLRIKYEKPKQEEERVNIYKGIARRSFDLEWKVSTKFDLSKLEASLEKGLLTIFVPLSEERKPKMIEIKSIK
jgi:HSP20 family protein